MTVRDVAVLATVLIIIVLASIVSLLWQAPPLATTVQLPTI